MVILVTFSLILILGSMVPSGRSTAASLYTPPNTGSLRAVISRSPTPKLSTFAPWSSRSRMSISSRELLTVMVQLSHPAASSIFRASLVR